jgi:hypothetical protein
LSPSWPSAISTTRRSNASFIRAFPEGAGSKYVNRHDLGAEIARCRARSAAERKARGKPGKFDPDVILDPLVEEKSDTATVWVLTKRGQISADNEKNIRTALTQLGVVLRYDTFALRLLVNGRPLNDYETNHLRFTIKKQFGFRPPKDFFFDFVVELARENTFHPVLDYLDGLTWDGQERLSKWLVTYAGAEDNEYTCAVGELMLKAAVRRVRHPGAKFDEMCILVDPLQGSGKSGLLSALAVRLEWFTDSVSFETGGREMIEQLQGRWIVEFAELKGMRDTRIEKIKAQLSRQVDRGRVAYARFTTEAPRQCVFFGTTNVDTPLVDRTGNRRFWPIKCAKFEIAALKRDLDQLWAEAAVKEAGTGSEIRLDPKLWPEAARVQAHHTQADAWAEHLGELFGDRKGKVSSGDVWTALGVPIERRYDQRLVERRGEAMKAAGWEHANLWFDGRKGNGYVRGEGGERQKQIFVFRDWQTGAVRISENKLDSDCSF